MKRLSDSVYDISIELIKPYEKNAKKHPKEQIQYIANSIEKFGFKQPIVIDKNNEIVVGHGRYFAAKKLKIKEVPVVMADDLTEEEIKAYRLADNKLNESDYDFDILNIELGGITEIDMSDLGFNIEDLEEDKNDDGYYGDERERTFNKMNLSYFDFERTQGFYQMPLMLAETHIPDSLISFNYVFNSNKFEKGVHFFIDDYQFERVWNTPEKYMNRLSKFDCCLTPDFSLYMDMPIAMQVWNIYRSRLIGQIMQDNGIKVIPTLSWSDKDSYEFCFDGIEPGGVVAVSTVGVMNDKDAQVVWRSGMDEAIKRLSPKCVLVYGSAIDYDFKSVQAKYFDYRKW